LIHLAICKIC